MVLGTEPIVLYIQDKCTSLSLFDCLLYFVSHLSFTSETRSYPVALADPDLSVAQAGPELLLLCPRLTHVDNPGHNFLTWKS